MTLPSQFKTGMLLVLVLALSAFIQFTVVTRTTVDPPLRADAGDYFSYAFNLHYHDVYSAQIPDGYESPAPPPDRVRPPGYPLFLLLVGAPELHDDYIRRVVLAQAAVGVASVLLVFLLARQFLSAGLSLVVATVAATAPHLASISTYLLTEALYMFLLLASILALIRALRGGRLAWYALAGLLWGACSLVRSTTDFLPPMLLLAALLLPKLRDYRAPALLAFACFMLVLAPWLLRNRSEAVETPAPSLMVTSLLHGSYPGFMYENRPDTFGFPYRFDPEAASAGRDLRSVTTHIARHFAREPLRYAIWYLGGKPRYFLSWGNIQGTDIFILKVSSSPYWDDWRFLAFRPLSMLLHWPLMILGVAGALLVWWRPGWTGLSPGPLLAARLVALVVAYAIALHMVVAPFPRYGIPFRPLLYALAMIPLQAAWQRRKGGGSEPAVAGRA